MRLHIDSARRLGTIVAVIVVIALAAAGCGGKGPDIISPSETYIPDFNRTWRNAANRDHTFFFNPVTSGITAGPFDGNEFLPPDPQANAITGTYNGRNLTFTIARRGAGGAVTNVSVTGRFITTERIELTFPNNQLITLNRDPQ